MIQESYFNTKNVDKNKNVAIQWTKYGYFYQSMVRPIETSIFEPNFQPFLNQSNQFNHFEAWIIYIYPQFGIQTVLQKVLWILKYHTITR